MANKYRPGSDRAKVWETVRALKKDMTVDRLCLLTGARTDNVKRYVRALELAGYLRKQSRRKQGQWVYDLVKNSGPKAPVQKEIRTVWDPNTDECWVEGNAPYTEAEKIGA